MKWLALLLTLMMPATAMAAQGISLGWPVACNYGRDCFIQNYVDEDSTGAARDFTCGPLTYDGHKGTDIRLMNIFAMHKGIPVLAAADGTVRATRDGMNDISIRQQAPDAVKQRECGNGVVLDHPAGYETQYCHMMNGSILVTQGQKVKAGDVLGRIGMSGQTEFPHLHFEVRRLGRVIDPYTAHPAGGACGKASSTLWANAPAYIPTALLGHGFMPMVPKLEQVQTLPPVTQIPRFSPALVYWVELMGVRQDDTVKLTILSPNGKAAVTRDVPITRNLAQSFSFVGKKATQEGLVPGIYTATLTVKRKGQEQPVIAATTTVEVPF